ncbi:MAG: serine/threonine protein kinase, partial [Myxococcales bacterium]|nr:serine/threonine protein kinase [Myxococcales bacterium]
MPDAVMAGQGSEIAGAAGGPSAAAPGLVDLLRSRAANPVPDGDPPLAAGTVVDGRYRVLREIGAGGMGRVYEAEHMFLRRPMALKLLRRGLATAPEATARLIQEAMLAGQVPHSAVVRVFDCAALADGQVYLAMELLRGESLEQRLRRPGSAAEVVPLLAELARGLAAVHRVGVVHRDIKP